MRRRGGAVPPRRRRTRIGGDADAHHAASRVLVVVGEVILLDALTGAERRTGGGSRRGDGRPRRGGVVICGDGRRRWWLRRRGCWRGRRRLAGQTGHNVHQKLHATNHVVVADEADVRVGRAGGEETQLRHVEAVGFADTNDKDLDARGVQIADGRHQAIGVQRVAVSQHHGHCAAAAVAVLRPQQIVRDNV